MIGGVLIVTQQAEITGNNLQAQPALAGSVLGEDLRTALGAPRSARRGLQRC